MNSVARKWCGVHVLAAAVAMLSISAVAQMIPGSEAAPQPLEAAAPATDATAASEAELPTADSQATVTEEQAAGESIEDATGVDKADSMRDPFWPIGWKPAPMETISGAKPEARPKGPIRWDEATKMLELTALMKLSDDQYVATLKGIGTVEAGDTISVNYGGLTYRWEVRSITDRGIAPRRLGVATQRGN